MSILSLKPITLLYFR
jgi:hypothetical protein